MIIIHSLNNLHGTYIPRALGPIVDAALEQFPMVVVTGARPEIYYWRTASGAEVDFVVESRQGLLPIEVKMTSRARVEDVRSLELFLDEYSRATRIGLLFYGGDEIVPLTSRILAVPIRAVL